MTAIGFIGLGNMGGAMAGHLADAGHNLTVFDINSEACRRLANDGATIGEDPAAVARASEVVFLSLPTPETVLDVVEGPGGIAEGASKGLLVVDTSTSTPETTVAISEVLAKHEATVLGAPVSGGASGAHNGTLTTMIGGDQASIEACTPLLKTYSTNVYRIGTGVGDGHVIKLLNNYLSFLGMLGASEAIALGRHAGLDPEVMVEVFNQSTGRNAATEDKFPEDIIPGEYDLGFTIGLMHKDLRLFSRFASDADVPILLGDTVYNLTGYARAEFGDDADMSRVYDFMTERIGVVGADE